MSKTSLKEIIKKVEKAMPLVGWRSGNKFSTWIDEDRLSLAIEIRKGFKPTQKTLQKLVILFGAQTAEIIKDGNFVVIEEALKKEGEGK